MILVSTGKDLVGDMQWAANTPDLETLPKETSIWLATNQPKIFESTKAGETAKMSLQIVHEKMAQEIAANHSKEQAFVAGLERIQEMGSVHVGQPGHYLLGVMGHYNLFMMLQSLCAFPAVLNGSMTANLAQSMHKKDIGGIMCALALQSGLKLRRVSGSKRFVKI